MLRSYAYMCGSKTIQTRFDKLMINLDEFLILACDKDNDLRPSKNDKNPQTLDNPIFWDITLPLMIKSHLLKPVSGKF